MTRRESRHASERKSRIEEDKRLPEMAQLKKGLIRKDHEEEEIQRKVLRREKNLAFSEDTCLEKE